MSPGLSASMVEVAAMSDSAFWDEGPGIGVESRGSDVKSRGPDDESRVLDDEGHSVESNGLGLGEEEEAVPEGQQHAVSVLRTADMVLDLHQSPRDQRGCRSRQPTLTTWTDPKDGMVYIDVPAYPPPSPLVQIPPSPEWSSGSVPISPSPSIAPLPISSPMIPLAVPSPIATPVMTKTEGFLTELYDRDIGELFTRSGMVKDEIFSQRYQFRSLEHEKERVAVTFGALWRPVELQLQLTTEERSARLELAEIVDSMRRRQEPRGDV
ncbi:hypothetical protein Tco_0593188 [Tanacetum coccineum]